MGKKVSLSLLAVLLISALALSACSGQSTRTGRATQNGSTGGAQGTVTEETKLAIGIMKLEGTSQAVTTEQAKVLLPLWKAERSLEGNSSTAEAELQALTEQIKGSLTAEQLEAINKIDFSQQNLRTLMSELNIGNGSAQASSGQNASGTSTSSSSQRNFNGGGGGGGMGGGMGGPPGGGFGGGPGGDMGGGTMSTQSSSSTRTATTQVRVNTFLVNALITLLTGKVGA
ncbi:MAG: hypothetical protein LWX83_00875 [Anaerolineae bacterium]|nr:hypothetical protein [Anaerolineae bacterium]